MLDRVRIVNTWPGEHVLCYTARAYINGAYKAEVTAMSLDTASDAARELGKLGAQKGAKARNLALSPEQRSDIARGAAEARWGVGKHQGMAPIEGDTAVPKAEWPGEITLGALTLPCAVLADGTRVLSERGVTKAFGAKRAGSHWLRKRTAPIGESLPVFASAGNLEPFISASLKRALTTPIRYRGTQGAVAFGYQPELLAEICEVWIDAHAAGALRIQQEHIAEQARILHRALARVAIAALIDEATGYEKVRPRLELHRLLAAYISPELLPWSKRFPDEFYLQMFRLMGWEYKQVSSKRPTLVGKLTMDVVYKKLPPAVVRELKNKNPVIEDTGRRRHKFHQFLTEEVGNPHLEKHLAIVTALMRASGDWKEFKALLTRAVPTPGEQLPMLGGTQAPATNVLPSPTNGP